MDREARFLTCTRKSHRIRFDFEIREVLGKLREKDPRKLLEDVYRNFQFDLCDGCREKYVKDPLATCNLG